MSKKPQSFLFHESLADALKEVIAVAGGTKSVACKLWPEKTPDAAQRTLLDCLNDNRSEKLSPDQVLYLIRLGREIGCHAAINYITRDSGYSDPQPIEPEDEKAKLMREFITTSKGLSAMVDRMEKLGMRINE